MCANNWGNFDTHDTGNFTIIIDDDGGSTAWNTLEFPLTQDRLNHAYFGLGTSSNSVDFGKIGDLSTVSPLNISSPGNHTDEEGFCRFSGFPGEDFDDVTITQRTYVNRYRADTRGSTGRWMVVDYLLGTGSTITDPLHVIQMMDVDLSGGNDRFIWDPAYKMTVTWYGTTYIGLAYFVWDGTPLSGHNAGQWIPSSFNTESDLFAHMSSPNDQGTSNTEQNWYMDLVATVPSGTFPGQARVAFAVVVGSSQAELREAVNDAKWALKREWTSDPPTGWNSGVFDIEGSHTGFAASPGTISAEIRYSQGMEGPFSDWESHPFTPDGSDIRIEIASCGYVQDMGRMEYRINSRSLWGFEDIGSSGSLLIDNLGPDVNLDHPQGWATGSLIVTASGSDRGGSGTKAIFMSADGVHYGEAVRTEITREGGDISIWAYAVDNAGNIGELRHETGLKNDGTPPVVDNLSLSPSDINEKTVGKATISLDAHDRVSGISEHGARYRYGLDTVSTGWLTFQKVGDGYLADIDLSWGPSQRRTLIVEVELTDIAGHNTTRELREYIEPVNDRPEFTLHHIGEVWTRDEVGFWVDGSDPDGDVVDFTFEYNTDEFEEWYRIQKDDLTRTDSTHYIFNVGWMRYEGVIRIRGKANDGREICALGPVTAMVDLLPPVIKVEGAPDSEYSRGNITIEINSSDGGSGIESSWFITENGGGSERVDGKNLYLYGEGRFDIKMFSSDRVGNTAETGWLHLAIDRTPPEIFDVNVSEAVVGSDLMIQYRARDSLSGVNYTTMRTTLIRGEWSETVDYHTRQEPVRTVCFYNPFKHAGPGDFRILIELEDQAGNGVESVVYEGTARENFSLSPVKMGIPDRIDVGKGWRITLEHDGPVKLTARYPNTSHPWTMYPSRVEGNLTEFEMPGSYAGDVEIGVLCRNSTGEGDWIGVFDGWRIVKLMGYGDGDGDLLEDHWEDRHGFDANEFTEISDDSDGDGLNLLQEMYNLTSPDSYDTDGDSMDDGWEARMGTLPFHDDGWEDPDGDSWANLEEFLRNTDPLDPEDHPEEYPPTSWYWILLIMVVFMGILAYFVIQMFNRKKLERSLEFDEEGEKWDLEEP